MDQDIIVNWDSSTIIHNKHKPVQTCFVSTVLTPQYTKTAECVDFFYYYYILVKHKPWIDC